MTRREYFARLLRKFCVCYTERMKLNEIQFISRVSCGLFGIAEDHLENYLSLDERFVRNKTSTYFFEAEGDSMEPLIASGDVLVVDRSLRPQNTQVIVACYEGQLICKRLFTHPNYVTLRSDNERIKPIRIEDGELEVFGVVIGLARHVK